MKLAIAAAVVIATGVQGYRMGVSAEETRAALRLAKAERSASLAEAARLELQAERDLLAQTLEDAAHADPDADVASLGADSVRRLNQR